MLEWIKEKLHARRIDELEALLAEALSCAKEATEASEEAITRVEKLAAENQDLFRENGQMAKLEAEAERLRDENRQLVNSLLASHGMQQVEGPRSKEALKPIPRANWLDYRRKKEREAAAMPVGPPPDSHPVAAIAKKAAEAAKGPDAGKV
jgi:hypothetical protein